MKYAIKIMLTILGVLYAQAVLSQTMTLSGDYRVGYKKFQIEDRTRKDLLQPLQARSISITIYYPSTTEVIAKESYIREPQVLEKMIEINYLHQNKEAISNLKSFYSNAAQNLSVSKGRFPVLLFSHGLGVSSVNYQFLLEDLASLGYIVVAIDHPYGGFSMNKNGSFTSSRLDPEISKGEKTYYLKLIKEWAKDQSLVLDQLLNKTKGFGKIFKHSIDAEQIYALGHSLGGNTAVFTSFVDHKIRGAINLDGGTFDVNQPLPHQKNILVMRSLPVYTDDELKKKGRNPEDWRKMGETIDQSFSDDMLYASNALELKIRGAAHMSFSDTPFVLPQTVTQFGGQMLDEYETYRIIKDAIQQFLKFTIEGKTLNAQMFQIDPEVEVKLYGA